MCDNNSEKFDSATEYENHACSYLKERDQSLIGYKVVQQWASQLPDGSDVIEIACGGGYPVTKALSNAGLNLWAIDSSKTLLSEFKKRYPHIPVECKRVQDTSFFSRKFDAAIAIGIIFLLSEQEQENVIASISQAVNVGGHFLFTAPTEKGTWEDLNTGILCRSLGFERYTDLLNEHGFKIISTLIDDGQNNYYEVERIT